ncbi:hypothetical protein [Streptomyces megasporus]|uniref:hypothetical protein n=1 Tax=Streptomyces megasporus TaxID=44060 RepID=UPI0004E19766|nr:hypothetical protein [Streptomyces megasporus]
MPQAIRSTRLAKHHSRHLGTELTRILVMGEQVHAEASHVLTSSSTKVGKKIFDLVFREHSYLRHTSDLNGMIRKAVNAKILTREDATTLDCDTIAKTRNKKPQTLAAL